MALNVPYQDTQPTLSLADSVGKWTQINNQQAAGKLAQQQEQRLQQQNERENKMGELKFGIEQKDALKSVATDYKAALQRKSGELGIKPGTPEYQQLANAMYANNYGQIFTNITGKTHNPSENIDLNAVDALAGMTPAEQAQAELQSKKTMLDLELPYKLQVAEAQAGFGRAKEERQFENQREMKLYDYQNEATRDDIKYQRDLANDERKAQLAQQKPLPSVIVKQQQQIREQIGIASSINADLADFSNKLDKGELNLSLAGNAVNKARNYLGLSNEESTALASFNAALEKMRNDSLRLNSGVQTEGDAQRAWNELFQNINDEELVKERLQQIQSINKRAIDLKINDINAMRSEYNKPEIDASQFDVRGAINHTNQAQTAPDGVDPARWELFLKSKAGG